MRLPAIRLSARVRGMAAIVVGAVLLAGCGTSDRQQVHAKVEQFAVAVAHKDAKTICDQVFAPSLISHFTAAGLTCERGLGIFFSGLQNPTLALGPITVHGTRASAVTLSSASGQSSAVRAINLVKTADGWRIVSLGASPASGTSTTPPSGSTQTSAAPPPTSTHAKHATTSKH